jgi:hypothetical protein
MYWYIYSFLWLKKNSGRKVSWHCPSSLATSTWPQRCIYLYKYAIAFSFPYWSCTYLSHSAPSHPSRSSLTPSMSLLGSPLARLPHTPAPFFSVIFVNQPALSTLQLCIVTAAGSRLKGFCNEIFQVHNWHTVQYCTVLFRYYEVGSKIYF